MNFTGSLRTRLAAALLSQQALAGQRRFAEWRRRLWSRPHTVHAFLDLDDAYSYLLASYLPQLRDCYDIKLQIHMTTARDGAFHPQPAMLAEYANLDCQRLAMELDLPFLDKGNAPPIELRRALLMALADNEHRPDFSNDVYLVMRSYWRGDAESSARLSAGGDSNAKPAVMLQRNRLLLEKRGHYDTATLFYAGEWYWGIDRLHYLMERLDDLHARREAGKCDRLESLRQVTRYALPVTPPAAARQLPPLEFFFSFRSPYSYLALQRSCRIADAYSLRLKLLPVLPMKMRGMPVPLAKQRQIVLDAAREARRLELAFGKIAEPRSATVQRCLAVFAYAESERKARDFLLQAMPAIWGQGIDLASDRGLRQVTDRCGLFWPDVKAALLDQGWRSQVAANGDLLMESGCWGVPTLRLGEFTVWGQDRLWLLVREIEERCDTGDGILV